jgi:hypothetical protein
VYLRDKLAQQVGYMDSHPEVGMIYTSATCINGEGKPLDSERYKAWAEGQIYKQIRESGDLPDELAEKLNGEIEKFKNAFNVEGEDALT